MMSLLELQRAMRAALLNDGAPPPEILGGSVVAAARLGVYRNNVIGNLTRTLRLAFPAVERLVGADFFAGAAGRMIVALPPRSPDLHEYGDSFPWFLETCPPARNLAYLPEVARLEWAVNKALHARRPPPLDTKSLAVVPERIRPDLVLLPHPSLSLLHLVHPSQKIWNAELTADATERARRLAAIDLGQPDGWLAVLQNGGELIFINLSEPAFVMASALAGGATLAAALGAASPEEAAPLLAGLFFQGFFAGFRQPVIQAA